MKNKFFTAILMVATFNVAACAGSSPQKATLDIEDEAPIEKRTPHQAGVLLGKVIAAKVESIKEDDLHYHNNAVNEAFKKGSAVTWNNPDTGNHGKVILRNSFQIRNGKCQEYTDSVNINGESKRSYGTACRINDGVWKRV